MASFSKLRCPLLFSLTVIKTVMVSLKGTVQQDFRPPIFLSFEPAMATDQRVKIFSILVKNLQSYSNFKSENLTPQGIIPGSQTPHGIIPR